MADIQTVEEAIVDSQESGGPPATGGDERSLITALAVKNPPAPVAYQYLNIGPEMTVEMEENTVKQVDNTRQILRNLSPFIIQIEPPGVFQTYNVGPNSPSSPSINLYTTANGSSPNYQKARDAIAQDPAFAQMSGLQTSMDPEVYLAAQGYEEGEALVAPPDSAQPNKDQPSSGRTKLPDYLSVIDMRLQVANIMNIPPLVLLINPTSFQIQYTKIQQYQDRSRYGYILHTWGEDQAKISFTARCGAFISGGRGVHVASRNDSKSWQNMMNLVRFYKNNGYIYDTMGRSNAMQHVGALSIRYDGFIYYGSMESFTFEFNEDNELGGMEFNIEFTANGITDTSPDTFAVLPMRSPTPSIEDQRYFRGNSGGGGFGGDSGRGLGESTQDQEAGVGESFDTLVSQDGTGSRGTGTGSQVNGTQTGGNTGTGIDKGGTTQGIPNKPVGDSNFNAGGEAILEIKDVNTVSVPNAKPFGF